ncbi:hypothetical protein GMMP15_1030007 [Candidatus Magnetomoraceae bacterium gMMP-15]
MIPIILNNIKGNEIPKTWIKEGLAANHTFRVVIESENEHINTCCGGQCISLEKGEQIFDNPMAYKFKS